MDAMESRGIISDGTVATAKKYMKLNSDWIEYSDRSIQDYLDDYYGVNNGAKIARVSICTLFILTMSLIGSRIFL